MAHKRGDPRTGWGQRFYGHLQDNGLTVAGVAEKFIKGNGQELTEGALRHWLNGTRKINLVDFFYICEIAVADPVVILFGRPIMSDAQVKKIGGIVMGVLNAERTDGNTTTATKKEAKKRIGR